MALLVARPGPARQRPPGSDRLPAAPPPSILGARPTGVRRPAPPSKARRQPAPSATRSRPPSAADDRAAPSPVRTPDRGQGAAGPTHRRSRRERRSPARAAPLGPRRGRRAAARRGPAARAVRQSDQDAVDRRPCSALPWLDPRPAAPAPTRPGRGVLQTPSNPDSDIPPGGSVDVDPPAPLDLPTSRGPRPGPVRVSAATKAEATLGPEHPDRRATLATPRAAYARRASGHPRGRPGPPGLTPAAPRPAARPARAPRAAGP